MDKQVRPGPGRHGPGLHAACGAAASAWHRRAAAIKRQAYAFKLLRFGLGMSAQAKHMTAQQHACRPANSHAGSSGGSFCMDFSGHAPSLLFSVDPSFAFRAVAHTDTSHGTAADRSASPSGSGRPPSMSAPWMGGPPGNRHGFGERRKGWRD